VNAAENRRKQAELLSTTGAGVLGAGIALVFADQLHTFAYPLLILGIVAHAWGMYEKHSIESAAQASRATWQEVVYRSCWLALLVLVVYVAWRFIVFHGK